MRKRAILSVLICICSACVMHAQTDTPATTQPVAQFTADSPARKWFKQLADSDFKIRDKAKENLMGIGADDLPKLRQLVVESQPLTPVQSAALHEIVLQSFLACDKYTSKAGDQTDASGTNGPFFLGITWPPDNNVGENEPVRLGAMVDERLPGFPSYRFLRKGDMILGVYVHPDEPLIQIPNMEVHTRQGLIAAISSSPGAQKLVLQVLRDGESIKIPVSMAPRPQDADSITVGAMQAFNRERVDRADAYFEENFAPLLEPKIDASNLVQGP